MKKIYQDSDDNRNEHRNINQKIFMIYYQKFIYFSLIFCYRETFVLAFPALSRKFCLSYLDGLCITAACIFSKQYEAFWSSFHLAFFPNISLETKWCNSIVVLLYLLLPLIQYNIQEILNIKTSKYKSNTFDDL